MPNTGKPSPACHLCRKRRVQCDLTQPGCHRCAKIGKTCPGYRQELDLLFRNRDKKSFISITDGPRSLKKKQPARQKMEADPAAIDKPPTCQAFQFIAAAQHTPSICQPLSEDWTTYSVPIVLNHFSSPTSTNRSCGRLDFLPDIYCEVNDDSCLSVATKAFARAYIRNISNSLPDKEHMRTYGDALKSTNAALRDPVERVKDSTLIAVWLLGVHEILIDSGPRSLPVPEAYTVHCQGLVSLLSVRGPSQFSSQRGRNLFWLIYLFVQIHFLVANVSGPLPSCDWFDLILPHLTQEDQHAFAVANHNYRITLLCTRIHGYIKRVPADSRLPADLTTILTEADILQTDIQVWNSTFTYDPTDLTPLFIQNTLRAALLKLQYFILLLVCYPDRTPIPNFEFRRQHALIVLRNVSRKILDSVPVALGDSDTPHKWQPGYWAGAVRLVWPLSVVSRVPGVLPEDRREARSALERIGKEMGIRLALDCFPPLGRFAEDEDSTNTEIMET